MVKTPKASRLRTRLKPSAMLTPVRSVRVMMGRIPARVTESMRVCWGKAATHSTPSAFRIRAMPSLTVAMGRDSDRFRFSYDSGPPTNHL